MENNKKYISIMTDFLGISGLLTTEKTHILELSNNFEKVFIINTKNLEFFSKKKYSDMPNLIYDLPKNIELVNPQNVQEFKNFLSNKKIIVLNFFGRSFKELKIHFLIKKFNLPQVQITTVGNEQFRNTLSNKFLMKKINFLINRILSQKICKFLALLNLVQKIDIRFISNKYIIENINNSFFKKFLYEKKLLYTKKIVLVNSLAYDHFQLSNQKITEEYIVHIDTSINYYHKTDIRGKLEKKYIDLHYLYLEKFLKKLSNEFKKKVIVCIHPAYNYEEHKKYLKDFDVIKYKTREKIYNAFLVTFFDSSAILDAVLLKKRIIGLISNFMGENDVIRQKAWANKIGCMKQEIKENFIFDKNKILIETENNKKNFDKYIYSYLCHEPNTKGIIQIIKQIKETYF